MAVSLERTVTILASNSQEALHARHPLVRAFFTYRLVNRVVVEDGEGNFFISEVRRDKQGERLRYIYPLDTLHREAHRHRVTTKLGKTTERSYT